MRLSPLFPSLIGPSRRKYRLRKAFWAGWPKEEQTGLEGRLVDKATGEELASRLKGKLGC